MNRTCNVSKAVSRANLVSCVVLSANVSFSTKECTQEAVNVSRSCELTTTTYVVALHVYTKLKQTVQLWNNYLTKCLF